MSAIHVDPPGFMATEELACSRPWQDASSTAMRARPMSSAGAPMAPWTGSYGTRPARPACSASAFRKNTAAVAATSGMRSCSWNSSVCVGSRDSRFPCTMRLSHPTWSVTGWKRKSASGCPRLSPARRVLAVAMSEPAAGSDLQGMRTTARRDGDHYVINGQKTFITNGLHATLVIVAAKTGQDEGAKGISLFAVEADKVEGFDRGRLLHKLGQEGRDTTELFFHDMRVPAENLLGGVEGRGFQQLMEKLPQERMVIAWQSMASIERALEATIDYAKERQAFGKRVIDFQNTQFKLAECKTQAKSPKSSCTTARNACYSAPWTTPPRQWRNTGSARSAARSSTNACSCIAATDICSNIRSHRCSRIRASTGSTAARTKS
ncbi:acyl-CoA dehydrogenase AcdA (plasmid) [Cupriavidus necator N-1]|uniref:Acyl-[acyl-carrier-protein] dehydrogenase MbtN n=1 Tax=Cupriavidus necator (strain ATCC 43291 / DSM 13513 / CCUG 52238 / LMG 8453 / N-1) TaxID=1042878 RepID=F8GWX8_CUPNN|nr:acyl-CoA dehydrogenase AcdA [Cupriavidus necator N-1]